MKSFGEKIRDARIRKGYTQKDLAKMIGVAHNSISGWENDKNRPDPDSIELLCGVLDVSPNYLLSVSSEEIAPAEKNILNQYRALDSHGRQVVDFLLDAEFKRVQQIIAVSKGEAIVEGVGETIAVPLLRNALSAEKIPPGDIIGSVPVAATGQVSKGETDLFALKVTNESMAPRISTGDTVIVRKQDDVNSGEVAVVVLDGTTVVCKQVIKEGNTLRLVPLNGEFQTREFRRDDPKKRFKIIGRVIENIQAV